MIETDNSILIHTPRCGGTTLYKENIGTPIHRAHDGIYVLTPEQRKKRLYVLTRERKAWYQSLFQYCVQTGDPWMTVFGLAHDPSQDNFKEFIHRATLNPPRITNIKIPWLISVPFDGFTLMRQRNYGFWSAWHEFLSSDDPTSIKIATDVKFLPCGHKNYFSEQRHNTSTEQPYIWTNDMLSWLKVDDAVSAVVGANIV